METGKWHNLDDQDRPGLIVATVISAVSAISVSLLLLHISSVTTSLFCLQQKSNHSEERVFLRSQIGVLLVFLLVSNLYDAVGGLIQGKWAATLVISQGPACTLQGVMFQLGSAGSAIWTLVIAAHSFVTIVLGKRMSKGCFVPVIIGGWAMSVMLTILGPIALATPVKGPFYDVGTLRWCFIQDSYSFQRTMVFYLPEFVSGCIVVIFHALIFLTLRGNLLVNGWKFSWRMANIDAGPSRPSVNQSRLCRGLARVLWYPVVYMVLMLPLFICRLGATEPSSPFWQVAFCGAMAMGFANSILYVFTRYSGPLPLLPSPIVRAFSPHVTNDNHELKASNSPGPNARRVQDRAINSIAATLVFPVRDSYPESVDEKEMDEKWVSAGRPNPHPDTA